MRKKCLEARKFIIEPRQIDDVRRVAGLIDNRNVVGLGPGGKHKIRGRSNYSFESITAIAPNELA